MIPVRLVLLFKQFPTGHAHDAHVDAVFCQLLLGLHSEVQFRAGGDDDGGRVAIGRFLHDVGTSPHTVPGMFHRPFQHRQPLSAEGEDGGAARLTQYVAPRFRCLDGIAGTKDVEVRNGPEGSQVFHRLMGRAVFADPDAVVGEDVHDRLVHEGGEADGRSQVVGKDEERAAVRAYASVQGETVHDAAHGVFPYAVPHVAAAVVLS